MWRLLALVSAAAACGSPDGGAGLDSSTGDLSMLSPFDEGDFHDFAVPPLFARPVSYGAGSRPTLIALGDINADSILDVVVGDTSGNQIYVLFGAGDGTLGLPHATALPLPKFIAVIDANHDNRGDVLAGYVDTATQFTGVELFISNGDGTFAAPIPYLTCDTNTGGAPCPQGGQPWGAVVADFNGDTNPDVALTQQTYMSGVMQQNDANVSVLLETTGGGLSVKGPFRAVQAVPGSAGPIAAGDFNGDSKYDVVVSDPYAAGQVSVMLGNGDGTLQAPLAVASFASAGSGVLAAGGFDNDAHADLIDAAQQMTIALGNGDGTFGATHTTAIGPTAAIVVDDFNRDTRLDLALAVPTSGVVLALGDGLGHFVSFTYPAGVAPAALANGDLNGDGKPDLVVADTAQVQVLLNTSP
jgi:FG-GAP-like repeat